MYYGSYYSSDYNLENKMNEIEKLFDQKVIDRMNHIGLRGQVKWRVSPHFVH